MSFESITDERIEVLIKSSKRVLSDRARQKREFKYIRRNFDVVNEDGRGFLLYTRQNVVFPEDFSCGLTVKLSDGRNFTLIRYNGSSHFHMNRIEKMRLSCGCHIHKATRRYIESGFSEEGYAELTNRYSTLEGAFTCLLQDCCISGLETQAFQRGLFNEF